MGLLRKLDDKLKSILSKILDSIGKRLIDQDIVEDFSASNFRGKFTLKHFKKVIRDDYQALKEEGLVNLVVRWGRRLTKLLFFVPGLIRRRFIIKRIEKSRQVLKEVQIKEIVETKSFPYSLSVVINTKNSPPFFKEILQKYKNQIGFKKIEIIIVDSGSTDDTLKLAKYYGCKIIEIEPEEFRHGRSRNIGIAAASGKYIINAVSDAIPATLDLTYKVATRLEEERAGAISVRQIPRVDSDLFAAWSVWQHYQYIFGGAYGDVWVSEVEDYDSLPLIQKRKLAIIDDVFVLHRAKVIKKEKYNNDIRYGEDLLLSINHVKKGIKIGVLQSEAIIHSHSRPPEYFIKRYFVDANVIYEVFGIIPNNINKRYVADDESQICSGLLSIVKSAESKILKDGDGNTKWLEKYSAIFDGKSRETNKKMGSIWAKLYDEIYEKFIEFISQTGERLEGYEDVKSRIAAITSGTLLSEYFLKSTGNKKITPILARFKEFMEGEI